MMGSVGPAWSQCGEEPPAGTNALGTDQAVQVSNSAAGARRYAPGALLGRGGMGEVWTARDKVLQRDVAIKLPGRAPGAGARLLVEAQVAARLEHPAIVPIYDQCFGDDGQPLYAMRLVRGQSLHEHLAGASALRDRLRHVRALLTVAQAVAYAHSHGVIHCDLKPANIMLGTFGETQVLDWGLARLEQSNPSQRGHSRTVSASTAPTAWRAISGTPGYMSPEQAQGAIPTAASDIWSLGAILYELLTGSTPDSWRFVPVRELAPNAPADLSAVAERALQPDPAARYQSAAELAADLEAWLDGRQIAVHRYTARELAARFVRTFWLPLAVGGALLGLLVATAGWFLHRLEHERDVALAARAVADGALASARADSSRAAWVAGAWPEACVLAGDAQRLAPDAESLGVAAAGVLAATAAASTVETGALSGPAGCTAGWRGPHGVVCSRDSNSHWATSGGMHVPLPNAVVDAVPLGNGWLLVHRSATGYTAATIGTSAHPAYRSLRRFDAAPRLSGEGQGATIQTSTDLVYVDPQGGVQHWHASGPDTPWTAAAPHGANWVVAAQRGGKLVSLPTSASVPLPMALSATEPTREQPHVLAANPASGSLALGTTSGELTLLDAQQAHITHVQTGLGQLRAMLWSPDGALLAVLGERGGVRVYATGSLVQVAALPQAEREGWGWLGDRVLWTLGKGRWQQWRLTSLTPPRLVVAPVSGLTCAEPHPNRPLLAAGAGDGKVHVLDTQTGAHVQTLQWSTGVIKRVSWSRSGHWLAATDAQHGALRVVRTSDWQVDSAMDQMSTRRIAFLRNDLLLVAPYSSAGVLFGKGPTGWQRLLATDRGAVADAAVSPNGRYGALLAVQGGVWAVVDADAPAPLRWQPAPEGALAVAMTDEADRALFATKADVQLWSAGQRVRKLSGCLGRLLSLAASADAAWVAAGTAQGSVCLWTSADGKLRARLDAHTGHAAHVAFGRDNAALWSSGWDGVVQRYRPTALLDPGAATHTWPVSVEEAIQSLPIQSGYMEKL